MLDFDEKLITKEYKKFIKKQKKCLNDIKQIVINSKALLEGNSFYVHNTLDLYLDLFTKQVNLFWCGLQAKSKICEIGFNAGHSAILMLMSKSKDSFLDFTIFDIGDHPYTKPCLEYLKSIFLNVNFEYLEGDSLTSIPEWIKHNNACLESYDVVHVDGSHSDLNMNDLKNADLLVKKHGIIIVDDTNFIHINNSVDSYILSGKYKEVNVLETKGYPHRIIQKY